MTNTSPCFAVVGHPNKGKSSIVATLTRQDAVKISELSGTTTQAQAFALQVNNQTLYTLIDTPGFQRPRQVLHWLEAKAVNAAQRQQAVIDFIEQADAQKFHDEKELLQPILNGAGILYVVDGSIPYSGEFEAEMSILQWTSAPRMALINPIGGEQYIDQWQQALSQFFSVVRVFNPMSVDQQKQAAVLSAFAELYEPWRAPLNHAITQLAEFNRQLDEQGAELVVAALIQMQGHKVSRNVPASFAQSALSAQLKTQYQQELRDIESALQRKIQALYAHPSMLVNAQRLEVETPDLFDTDQWYLYGLDRNKLVALATSVGMAAGAAVDASVGGASLMAGAIAGGVVSSIASVVATLKPEKLNIKGMPLAGKKLTAGPVKALPFSYVLLGRGIDFLGLIRQRTHADRRTFDVAPSSMTERVAALSKTEQIKLTRILLKSHKGLNNKELLQLRDWILRML